MLLLDKQGMLRCVLRGFRPGDEEVISRRIEELLAEPPLPGAAAPR
jgi:hypothetical protein